jgi:hypothetical protein
LLKYAPGKRGVIAYHLSFADEERTVYGKLYRKDRGRIIFDTLQALWQASQTRGCGFAIPRPLAYCAELGLVLQSAAPGRGLATISQSDELFLAVQLAAKNLAALHALQIGVGEVKTFEDHLQKYCHPGPHAIIEAHPELGPVVSDLVAMMRADESLRSATLCALHGDLNLAQIFITPERAVFIDFDGFCRSHAALDVGNFLVTLAERYGEKSGELRHAFLEAYLAATPTHALPGLRTYQAFAYLRRAIISLRLQDEAERRSRGLKLLQAGLALMLS